MKKFFLALLFLFSLPAAATTTYFNDCGTGSTTGCVSSGSPAGTQANPYKTLTSFATVYNAAQPGDQILFAQCGAFDGWGSTGGVNSLHNTYAATSLGNLNTMAANPVIVDSYTPASCVGAPKPILNSSTTNGDYVFHFFANANDTGGVIFRNLRLEATGYHTTVGIGILRFGSYITIDNLTVNGFGSGLSCTGQPAFGYPHDIIVKNNTITNNGVVGIGYFGCSNVTVDHNTIDNNGFDDGILNGNIQLNHSLYISGVDQPASSFSGGVPQVAFGNVIRNNTVTRSSLCPGVGTNGYNTAGGNFCVANSVPAGRCSASQLVVHDRAQDWVIENNFLSGATGAAGSGCFGIDLVPGDVGYSSYAKRFTVRGNIIANPGLQGMRIEACQDCLFENNLFFWEASTITSVGGSIFCITADTNPDSAIPETTYQNNNLTIRNNTCWIAASTSNTYGIRVQNQGTGHRVINNLLAIPSGGTTTSASCFDITGLTSAAFAAFDYNECYHFAGWTDSFSTLALWHAANTWADTNSIPLTTLPVLVGTPTQATPSNAAISSTSPAKFAGTATNGATRDITTCLRPTPPSMGAYDYFASACGTKPADSGTGLR